MSSKTGSSPYARLRSTGISDVRWTSGFWADRIELCHRTMVPNLWRILVSPEISHAYANFSIAAGLVEGQHKGPPFLDGDFYKWLEATAYIYAVTEDAALDRLMDEIIAVIGKAQRADGYLHTPVVIQERQGATDVDPFPAPEAFVTYNFGHLMTAACAHYHATGKAALLEIAEKLTSYLYSVYKTAPATLAENAICPSHYMGVVDMYRVTRNPQYLDLARGLIDIRDLVVDGTDHNQDRIPFRQQTKAVGHAVRANYLYAGVADVYAETGDTTLLEPLRSIWTNVVSSKMYVTGATGALYDGASPDGGSDHKAIQLVHQAYGREYQLPNITAYNESCATIGFGLWNLRMLAITGETRYADILERVLYNGLLGTISLDGKKFFYRNTLRQVNDLPFPLRFSAQREPYMDCFCCPPNIVRTIAQVGTYAYGLSDGEVWVHLYGSHVLDTTLEDGSRFRLVQETEYPWEGKVRLTVREARQTDLTLMLRIPAWAGGATVRINGRVGQTSLKPGTYVSLRRTWSTGDVIDLDLPMRVRLLVAHPLVEESQNHVAIQRGPIVYCLESPDLPAGVPVSRVVIPRGIELTPRFERNLLGGVTVLEGQAKALCQDDWSGQLYREAPHEAPRQVGVRLIPYYAWGNRGSSEMAVWLPVDW